MKLQERCWKCETVHARWKTKTVKISWNEGKRGIQR